MGRSERIIQRDPAVDTFPSLSWPIMLEADRAEQVKAGFRLLRPYQGSGRDDDAGRWALSAGGHLLPLETKYENSITLAVSSNVRLHG